MSLVLVALVAPAPSTGGEEARTAASSPSLLLVTLDTTRADALGAWSGGGAATPNLDALAAAGVRYARSVAPSPLTLPSHATLLTGLDPLEHGVRGNGTGALPAGVATLAGSLRAQGFATAAVVASRVLDRRFGLDRGFDLYDDAMLAEHVGEYGYPERTADAVTDVAVGWLEGRPPGARFFLWVHYYDPHAPYAPPPGFAGRGARANYLGEVAFVDRELGRLVAAARGRAPELLVAAVGDHGEALGEHGERGHGVFLYRTTVEVPMILTGPGVPRGRVVEEPVGVRRLPATVLELLGLESALPGPALPGLSSEVVAAEPAILSEATMPADVYGWAPLAAVTHGRWRYVEAPRPELYDVATDPGELVNLVNERPEEARRLRSDLERLQGRVAVAAAVAAELDSGTRAALRALGYLEATPGRPGDGLDPKDGIALLAELDRAKTLMGKGQVDDARSALVGLVARNPSNVPFLARLAEAQLAAGAGVEALDTLCRALALSPRSELLQLARANTLARLNRRDEAGQSYREVLRVDPRNAPAWLSLAALAATSEERRRVLAEGVAAGVTSGVVLLESARLEAEAGRAEVARDLLDRAAALMPGAAVVWLERARLDLAAGLPDGALAACRRAAELEPGNAETALCSGRAQLARGEPGRARPHLHRAVVLGRGTGVEAEARRLLEGIEEPAR